jgi:hypothetical protein
MRIAIVPDIYGNLTAFDAVLAISGRLRDLVLSGDRRQRQRRASPVGNRSVLVGRGMFTQRLKSCFVVSPALSAAGPWYSGVIEASGVALPLFR